MKPLLTIGVFASTLMLSSLALADDSSASSAESSPNGHVMGGLGYLRGVDGPGALVADVLALKRLGPLAVGGNAQAGTAVLSNHYVSLGPSLGLFLPSPRWLEVGIVATAGGRAYSGFSRRPLFMTDNPGASAVVGFASVRVVLAYSIRTKTGGVSIGVQGTIDDDFARTKETYSYTDDGGIIDFNGRAPQTVTSSEEVGALRAGGMLTVGASF